MPITKATQSTELPAPIGSACLVDKKTLLARLHAQENDQDVVDGAPVFAAMWRQIPQLRRLGNAARNGAVLWDAGETISSISGRQAGNAMACEKGRQEWCAKWSVNRKSILVIGHMLKSQSQSQSQSEYSNSLAKTTKRSPLPANLVDSVPCSAFPHVRVVLLVFLEL
jgi:hypothetical protein